MQFFHHPSLHRPRLGREVHSHQKHPPRVTLESTGILHLLDLAKSLLGGLVQFQLDDIYIVARMVTSIRPWLVACSTCTL